MCIELYVLLHLFRPLYLSKANCPVLLASFAVDDWFCPVQATSFPKCNAVPYTTRRSKQRKTHHSACPRTCSPPYPTPSESSALSYPCPFLFQQYLYPVHGLGCFSGSLCSGDTCSGSLSLPFHYHGVDDRPPLHVLQSHPVNPRIRRRACLDRVGRKRRGQRTAERFHSEPRRCWLVRP